MKSTSIKFKLGGLCLTLLALMLVVGGMERYGSEQIGQKLEEVSKINLPAIRNMSMADMMHDGLRAVAFRSLYVGPRQDLEQKKEVADELKEMSEEFNKYISEIDKLNLQPETKAAIEKVKPEMTRYIESTTELVALALSGRSSLAEEKVPAFQATFKSLESKMDALGKLIEKNAQQTDKEGESIEKNIKWIGGLLIILGLVSGSIVSFFIIKNLIRTLNGVIESLAQSSNEVSASSKQSAASATQLKDASTDQASSLQETMASAEEISAMVNQNAESAGNAKNAVDMNQQVSEEGTKSVTEMLQAIGEIKKTNDAILLQMESSNKEFAQIVKIISEIGDKTKVINDIVFQTKLLSFNASVEAARAGEHGKGFAVVAEEVGNLAQMSGNAAKEITDMLSQSIKTVNDIVEATSRRVDQLIEVGKEKISVGQNTAEKCQASLEKMSENAQTVASMVAHIARASSEQAQGVAEINKAITQLDRVTQQNSLVAQESSTQAAELQTESEVLSNLVRSLTVFVKGNIEKGPPFKLAPQARPPIESSLVSDRMVSIQNYQNKLTQKNFRPEIRKKAVGMSHIPSSEDPGFEEV